MPDTIRALLAVLLTATSPVAAAAERPNIVFIMADDQGYADLGCYGSTQILTPHMDRLAAEGMRFTRCYSGSAVCAPTRCVLMTGLHPGHCRRRDNTAKAHQDDFEGRPLVPLAGDDLTVATVLKRAGYVTGGFGKWGLGNPGTTGTPDRHGFDHFFGYLDQVHAHDYYTRELWRDGKMVPLPGNEGSEKRTYSHDVLADAALDFIRRYRERPFFLYLPYTPPHGKYVVPDDAPYSGKPWSQQVKNYAAMITRMDGDIGEMMALLKELKIDEKTMVFYTSDNGPNPPFLKDLDSNGPFRGIKRQLYEGGIRCPMIVRWPGRIAPGAVSDFAWTHKDFFATACELAGVEPPAGLDSISVLPTLLGKKQRPQPHLYWEMHSPFHQAVHLGDWKGLRWGTAGPMELYDLKADRGEERDVAAKHPDVVRRIAAIMDAERRPNRYWPALERTRPRRTRQAAPPRAPRRGPNVVLFFIDDMGWTDVGFMGSDYYETPHIDALAREGTVFLNAYANGPNCAPSRASLMSGQYTPRHGIFTVGDPARGNHVHRRLEPIPNRTVLDDRVTTIAEALKTNGYITATMGKWHLGKDPTTQGFDVNIAGREWGSPSGGGYHSPYRYPNLVHREKGEYLTDRLGREASKFIESHRDRPFFLYLTHYAVHTPIQGKAELVAKYREKPRGRHHGNPAYAAMVESVDDSVGSVLATVKELGLGDRTVVLFFSDNGGAGGVTSNHPLRGAKGMLYEGGIREPMIVRWPGVTRPGSVCREPVIGIDLYPTLLEITGTRRPANHILDGLSLVPLLRDPAATLDRRAIFWHFPCYLQGSGDPGGGPFRTTPAGAVRAGDWKLIEWFETGRLELYHLGDDLGETRNLARERPEKLRELRDAMIAWRREVGAPIPAAPNPRYDPEAAASPRGKKRRAGKSRKETGQ